MLHAGIDVSKAHLDLALLAPSLQRTLRFPNTPEGRQALLQALRHHQPHLVVLEPTGPYHFPLLELLLEAGLPVAAVNPHQAAAFRQASGERNKGDRRDALLLARLGQVYGETLVRARLPERTLRALKALVGYQDDLRRRVHAIQRQRESVLWMGQEEVLPFLEEELAGVRRLLQEVEGRIRELAAGIPEVGVVQELPGVGPRVAVTVLALLPKEVWGRAKAAAAYAGLVPERWESGGRLEGGLSRKGPGLLRRVLYMAALVAVRHDEGMGAFYRRLLSRGKRKKQALVAVAHKLLRRMMGVLREFYEEQGKNVPNSASLPT